MFMHKKKESPPLHAQSVLHFCPHLLWQVDALLHKLLHQVSRHSLLLVHVPESTEFETEISCD